jgi:segregation and condensation protein B
VDEERLRAVLESLLFASGEPVSLARLAAVLEPVPKDAIRKALSELKAGFYREGRGVMLDEVAGGYQLRTPKEHALYVRKLLAARPPRLSRPMMETLAIIAYRQPITRPEIEQLRGVDSGAVLETLTERRFVKIAGRKEAPGRPLMYATTAEFLQTFGLKDLDSLPDLGELREVEQRIESAEQQRLAEAAGPEQLELMPPDSQAPPEQLDLVAPDAQEPGAGDPQAKGSHENQEPEQAKRSDEDENPD